MKDNKPLVSIIIPAYNAWEKLPNALASIESQTYENIETIIVDDCSQDNVDIYLLRWRKDHPNFNIKCERTDIRRNKAYSLNLGIDISEGELLTFMHAHDVLPEYSISERIDYLLRNQEKDGVFGKTEYFKNAETGVGFIPQTSSTNLKEIILSKETYFHLNSLMIRKSALQKLGLFDETLNELESVDFTLKVLNSCNISEIDSVVYHHTQKAYDFFQVRKENKIKKAEWDKIIEKYK